MTAIMIESVAIAMARRMSITATRIILATVGGSVGIGLYSNPGRWHEVGDAERLRHPPTLLSRCTKGKSRDNSRSRQERALARLKSLSLDFLPRHVSLSTKCFISSKAEKVHALFSRVSGI